MVGFNLTKVNGGITFVTHHTTNVKFMMKTLRETVAAQREVDRLLFTSGMMSKIEFYSNELAYCRAERVFLALK